MGKHHSKLMSAILERREKDPDRIFQNSPKPEKNADGKCSCGCCHAVDYGPCPKFYGEPGGRCAVCDHSKACHRRKGEPPPKNWNNPVELFREHNHVMSPTSFKCPHCAKMLIQCPKCSKWIPMKDYDSGYHIGNCPKDGYFDLACPKAK